MNSGRWFFCVILLVSVGICSTSTLLAHKLRTKDGVRSGEMPASVDEAELLEKSREAGLLTDWHFDGYFGHSRDEFARRFAPEKSPLRFERAPEMVFPEGTFVLPPELTSHKGVFYADSTIYLSGGGDWNVYLETDGPAAVFVDGKKVLESTAKTDGALRSKIHAESGYHSVLVKFLVEASPFRVAILPPNSGSRRKNNTPYLQASPAQEDMMAGTGIRFTEGN